ncbi:AAA family ATPase [Cohnella sp. REN36]|uniref:AAA family ATPase n=1 Tax=Cohnella sp. REN36 TaxID=2887347 RepID=UPI001D13BE0E|nr:SMC family ATPase [Cohnella sp. REN36]MCC3372789.1 SMC family ATPase [Cohnella sp. REN36]
MKPILLELAGIQSYREKQTVDFERLCQGGVFGIFGPTGSGKSSILDAMTLALYGRVERAPKGTQGILNGAESKLSVAMTFELSGAGERLRYRVERQYKRAGEVAVHGALCRLIELTPDGERVLADKQSEVDAEVERLIGLTMTDFTRAVVLPQGKFAEFLTLAGKDRRQMLQRLFRLERYGDALAARLSARGEGVRVQLKETEAEQLGLGDASPEAIAAANERLQEARRESAGLRSSLTEAESAHEALGRRRERQLELRRVEAEWAALARQAPDIAEQEGAAARLDRAAQALPALGDADEAERELAARTREREAALAGAEIQAERAAAAAAAWEAAQAASAAEEPALIGRLERLEQAVQLEEEARRWEAQWTEAAAALTEGEQRGRTLEERYAHTGERLRQARDKQQRLRTEWEALQPQAEAYSRLQAASARKREADAAASAAADARREAEERKRKEGEAADRLRRAETALREADAEGVSLYEVWGEAVRLLRSFDGALGEAASAAGAAAEREAALSAAARLAEGLAPGDACPVCGSHDHPAPAAVHAPREDADAWAVLIRETDALRREMSDALGRADWHRTRLGSLRADRSEPEPTAQAREAAAAKSAWTQAAAALADSDAAAFAAADGLDAWRVRFEALREAWNGWRSEPERLADRQSAWEAAAGAAARERDVAAEAAATAAETLGTALAKLHSHEQAEAAARQSWSETYPDLTPEGVEAAAASAAQAEEASRELRKRLDTSVTFIDEQEATLRGLERERHELAVRLADSRARAESLAANREGALAKLREWTGGTPAATLRAQAQERLAALRSAFREAKEAHEAAYRALQEAEAARTSAQERALSALASRERTATRLRETLAACGFGEADEVRALAPRIGEAAALKARIAAFRQQEQQLAGQLELLRGQVTGEQVAEADWTASAERLAALREAAEAGAAAVAKAERDAEDLAARRGRWEALETRRLALASDQARLAQLQSVFRGNAFVEYIAEEQLEQVCRTASERLGFLTRRRYALEVDASGGFVIRDDANGELRRPVSTLSGGETFLTSLALALALSAQIQLRGRYPLQFFFLDEGFGTLDQELLDTVVTSLEKLQQDELAVGVISHVPELQARLPRRLLVSPAEPGGRGSRITY